MNSVVELARSIIELCRELRELIIDEPRCQRISSPCYILGDIHGNYEDLLCFEKSLWRATPLLTPASFLFLGDYVDRGNFGLEVNWFSTNLNEKKDFFSLRSFFIFLQQNFNVPKNSSYFVEITKFEKFNKFLIFTSSNAIETFFMLSFIAFIFHRECLTKFGEIVGKEIWDSINSVFDVLPLAAVIDDQVKSRLFSHTESSKNSIVKEKFSILSQSNKRTNLMKLFKITTTTKLSLLTCSICKTLRC